MSNSKAPMDPETLLATLNQINQTIENLGAAVNRLQQHVQLHMRQQQNELTITASNQARDKKSLH